MLDQLACCAARNADVTAGRVVGRLPDIDVRDWVQLMTAGAQSQGGLRLFLADGREMHAHSVTEVMLRQAFPGVPQGDLTEALARLEQSRGIPMARKSNLFSFMEQPAP